MVYRKLKGLSQVCRSAMLGYINRHRLRKFFARFRLGSVPVFFIVTPDICHLTPFFLRNIPRDFKSVLVLNGVNDADSAWVSRIAGDVSVVRLVASFRKGSTTLVPHSDVLNALFAVSNQNFCIQDPDCFVIDPEFWDQVAFGDNEFAAGAFWEESSVGTHAIPQTYFLALNWALFRKTSLSFGIDAGLYHDVPVTASDAVKRMGYDKGRYPKQGKTYFDTLQLYWILSYDQGLKFRQLSGENQSVFHLGGTSYLVNDSIDVAYGEYWPLSVVYFNMRLLDDHRLRRFRERFQHLFDKYHSADQLLRDYPGFRECWRSKHIEQIIAGLAIEMSESW